MSPSQFWRLSTRPLFEKRLYVKRFFTIFVSFFVVIVTWLNNSVKPRFVKVEFVMLINGIVDGKTLA